MNSLNIDEEENGPISWWKNVVGRFWIDRIPGPRTAKKRQDSVEELLQFGGKYELEDGSLEVRSALPRWVQIRVVCENLIIGVTCCNVIDVGGEGR